MSTAVEFADHPWAVDGIQEDWATTSTSFGQEGFFLEDVVVEDDGGGSNQKPKLHRDLSVVYEGVRLVFPQLERDLSEMQSYLTYMCLCVGHTGFGLGITTEVEGMQGYWVEIGENQDDHDHCNMPHCGGHIDKNGNCDKCGRKA